MSWQECDEGFGSDDWLKWEEAPFVVTFKKTPPRFQPERDRFAAQAIFTVEHEGEEKNLPCSKRAYKALKEFGAEIGKDKFYSVPIQCVRKGAGFQTAYMFNVYDGSHGDADGDSPFVSGDGADEIPF